MKKLTKRISAAACSAVVAGVAVLGAGGAASAATPASVHAQRPAVSVKTSDHRWDHGVGYLFEEGYSWDRICGWHHDDCVTNSDLYGRTGHFYPWDDKECGWKCHGSHRQERKHCEHDGQDRYHNDR
ncbi:hypothetical protein ACFTY7_01505 [Streptomyces sp. NPDC057062]|uniref:hypothetical protein n=1 Tax=Streptomyces sp. NPDC057062 TaxID=3346011 RepID=UPI003627DEAB